MPARCRQLTEKGSAGETQVESVAFGRGSGQFRRNLGDGDFDLLQKMVAELDGAFLPAAGAEHKPTARLRVEKLVGEEDDRSGEANGLPEADGAGCAERMGDIAQNTGRNFRRVWRRLGSDLDPGELTQIVASEQRGHRGDDQFPEKRAGGRRSEEVRLGGEPDPLARGGVIAHLGIVEGEVHEGVKTQPTLPKGATRERVKKGGRDGGHGREERDERDDEREGETPETGAGKEISLAKGSKLVRSVRLP